MLPVSMADRRFPNLTGGILGLFGAAVKSPQGKRGRSSFSARKKSCVPFFSIGPCIANDRPT